MDKEAKEETIKRLIKEGRKDMVIAVHNINCGGFYHLGSKSITGELPNLTFTALSGHGLFRLRFKYEHELQEIVDVINSTNGHEKQLTEYLDKATYI